MGFDTMDQVVRDAIAEALKVGGKSESAVSTTINREKSEYSSNDDFAAIILERDAEITHLKAENAKLNGENSKLNAEISKLRG